jgi:hypothetical protein
MALIGKAMTGTAMLEQKSGAKMNGKYSNNFFNRFCLFDLLGAGKVCGLARRWAGRPWVWVCAIWMVTSA